MLPRGELPNPVSNRNEVVNEILKKHLEDRPQVEVICSGDFLRQSNGIISRKDMYDYLHLTEQGYMKAFTPVFKKVKQILNSFQ